MRRVRLTVDIAEASSRSPGAAGPVGPGEVLRDLPGPRLARDQVHGLDLVTHLLDTAVRHPGPLVVHAGGSFFAPHMGTVGCIEVRGADAIRQVLTNAEDFGPLQPDTTDLPEDVQSLSRGVFTFDGPAHMRHRAALRDVIRFDRVDVDLVRSTARAALESWRGRQVDLTVACRMVARDVLSAVLFGPGPEGVRLGTSVQQVVDARRARRLAGSPVARRTADHRLIGSSRSLSGSAAAWLTSPCRQGLLSRLGDDLDGPGATTQAVAHVTAVAAAATEPTAASLAWAVLALTQHPELQAEIRRSPTLTVPPPASRPGGTPDVLDRVVLESQRLFPSSAIVTRSTLHPVRLAGIELPERCEVIVSSLVSQRDPARFDEPLRFLPGRWSGLDVSPFEFFPFGSGVRRCMGASIARTVLRVTLAELLAAGIVRLPFDTRVAWQMPDALIPAVGVPIEVEQDPRAVPGRALGPLRRLACLDSSVLDGS